MKTKFKYSLFTFLYLCPVFLHAISKIDSLESVLKQPGNTEGRFQTMMELGNELINIDKNRTLDLANEAEAIARNSKNNKFIAQALLLKGRIAETEGKNKKALTYFIESNKLFEAENDLKGIGQTLNNIGIIHWYTRDYEKAIDYFNQAYEKHKAAGDKYGMSTNRVNKAIVYDDQGRYAEALEIYKEALTIFVELKDEWSIAACNNNMGLNYTATQQYALADKSYRNALAIYRKMEDLPGIASALNNIGYNLLQNKQYNEALPLLKESLEISEKEEYRYDQKLALLNLANSYYGIGQYKDAFEFHKKYVAVKDSILNTENSKSMKEMEARFSNEKKNLIIKNLEEKQALEKARQEEKDAKSQAQTKLKNTIVFSILGLVIITSVLLYWRYSQKKKDNLILQDKNREISQQKNIIEEKNKDITDSIQYAKTIQNSILPNAGGLNLFFPDSFILFLPRDIVSGDFYWFTETDEQITFTVGDCTGHGVPGSLMSMMGINLLHQIVREENTSDPAEILAKLDGAIRSRFTNENKNEITNDGMDIAIACLNKKNKTFAYASAMRPVYLVRNGELMELKNDVYPIGGNYPEKIFKTRDIEIREGDQFYLTTDGFADQFGGEKGKKFMTKRLKEMIQKIASQSMETQKDSLFREFTNWKGRNEQVDDVCIMGIRV